MRVYVARGFYCRTNGYIGTDGKIVCGLNHYCADFILLRYSIAGLAMSRSLGDTVAHTAGVISDPEMHHVELTKDDKVQAWRVAATVESGNAKSFPCRCLFSHLTACGSS